MRPTCPADKGKNVASASDTYAQTLLSNVQFKPQTTSIETMERMYFGKHNLICYPKSNLSFRELPECVVDRPQKCLVDNLWMAYNKKDNKYFIASLNALCQYFTDKGRENKFKYYVVIHGRTNGVFQTWIEVLDSINGVKSPLFKGFNDFTEALDYARGILGPNYYISPALRQNPNKIPQYNIQKDTDKIIFCDHCSSMTEAFKRLNSKNEALLQENAKLLEQLRQFKGKETQSSKSSFPSQEKMDEKGVHSPMNAIRSTVSDEKDTASPIQTVVGKDTLNPFMAVTLPKSEDENLMIRRRLPRTFNQTDILKKKNMLNKKKKNDKIESIIRQTLETFFQKEQDKHVVTLDKPDSQADSSEDGVVPDTEQSNRNNVNRNGSQSRNDDEYGNHSYYQDAQDPNEDDDSGMSFDSIALHNLDC